MRKLLFAIPIMAALLWGATLGNIQWTQLAASSRHGTGTRGQSSDNTGTSGNCAKFDASGNVTDAGAACGTVTSVTCGTGLSGGTITITGTCAVLAAGVTLTTGATATLSTPFTYNQEATAATAITYTLPTASAGAQYCIANSNNGSAATTGTLELATSASGQYIVFTDGTYSASGGYVISGGAAGDGACVVGLDSTHWQMYVQSGTWTKH